jgi:hypothetical protein
MFDGLMTLCITICMTLCMTICTFDGIVLLACHILHIWNIIYFAMQGLNKNKQNREKLGPLPCAGTRQRGRKSSAVHLHTT